MTTIANGKRPNVVWISLEDTSPRFGCYGDPVARTPNIDSLAAGGMIFRNAFSTAGVCAPSRSAIITGMYQTFIGTQHMRTSHQNIHTPELPTPYYAVPPAYVKTFTEYLRAAGYYCTNNRKTDYQFEPPVTAWDECSNHAHWRNREAGQPFFAVFNPIVTHESGMWQYDDQPLITDPDVVEMPPYLPDTPKARRALARQYDNIAEADKAVGQILDQLKEDGLAENTIVFLWSDHGEGLPRAKRWTYDAGIRVPLIVRWPGALKPGDVSDQLVSLIDLGPTVLHLTGTEMPYHLQGQPFIGPSALPRTEVFATRDRYDEAYDMVRAIRDKRFKYIRNFYPQVPYLQWIPYSHQHPILQELWRLHLDDRLDGHRKLMVQHARPAEELYDCDNDPHELHNLVKNPAYADVLLRMRETLDVYRQRYDTMGDIPEDRMVAAMWPGGVQPQTTAPIYVPVNGSLIGREAMTEGKFDEPTLIMLHSATQGASIAYTTESGPNLHWKLYTGPIYLEPGETRIRAKAVRIGYKESAETAAVFHLKLSY